jgi:DMSO/TMAO reductase YedYZ molybdopterin-dependent catalytic subunit
VHASIKMPHLVRALRSRPFREQMRISRADTRPEPVDEEGLVAADPAPATLSRRGALTLVGGGSLLVAVLTAGESIGGAARRVALLAPRGGYRETAAEFPVNRTAASAAIRPADVGKDWRLVLVAGARTVQLDRDRLLAMPQHTAKLPIACVEGWSTVQTWSGVRLRDLAALAGAPHPASAHVRSLERGGAFSQATLQSNQVTDPDALLALRVGGADLSPDHGFPARVIVPALPGVHNTKWVRSIEFRSA